MLLIAQAAPTVEVAVEATKAVGVTGNIASAAGVIAAAFAVGMIGTKAAEAVGRNPAASGKILVQSILGMALAEGLGLIALFFAK
jgi:F-type H+-transporting ATPase subunit c